MKAKNKFLTLLTLSAGAAASIAAINKMIQVSATSKNLLHDNTSLCYKWRFGNIHYTKTGSGKPLLLIHDLHAAACGYEWNQLIPMLKDYYTVYTIDLLGCGRSEKCSMTYTNYLYVQLLSDFIRSEIGHRTSVIATGESGSIPVMACANNPDLFDQLILINPLSLSEYSQLPGKTAKAYKVLVEFPIIGTLLYHIASSKKMIREELTEECFFNPYSVKPSYIDAYHEAAHLGKSSKCLYASIVTNFTKCNIVTAMKKIDNSIYLIGGECSDHMKEILAEYHDNNPAIETDLIPNTKKLPQLEDPASLFELIHTHLG